MRAGPPLLAALAVGLGTLGVGPAASGQSASDDPGLPRQWGLERIDAATAWPVSTGEGVTIAIVDSGVSPTHPDLVEGLEPLVDCSGGLDCRTGPGVGTDDAGHGTHVAGIAAATAGNGVGIAGVAPRARILSVKALANECDSEGNCQAQGTQTDVANAIRYAADHGAGVINLSLGSITQQIFGPGFADALTYAWEQGAIPVLAAGNEPLPIGSLVDAPAVIVAGTTRDDTHADYSGAVGNVRWALAAPGGTAEGEDTCASEAPNGILSTYFDPVKGTDSYACIAGTSMAAPHVAGALAVLLAAGLEPEAAIDRLVETADDLGAPGRDSQFGDGRINLGAAIAGLQATGGPPVVVDPPTSTSTLLPATTASTATVPTTVPAAGPPGTDPPGPATTVAPVVPGPTTPPVTLETATGAIATPPGSGNLPILPVTVAVLFVVAAAGAHAWRYLAAASWARRTPER